MPVPVMYALHFRSQAIRGRRDHCALWGLSWLSAICNVSLVELAVKTWFLVCLGFVQLVPHRGLSPLI